jgi:ornithine cyclodeaminase/alanine dehydrogenase-like protein (mu-crystallin family)
MLVLNNDEISAIIDMPTCIAAMETAYRGMSEGRGVNRRRSDTLVETGSSDSDRIYSLKSMDGVSPDLGVGAIRINSDIITYPEISGQRRRVKVPAAPGERFVGLVLLFSSTTGEPLAIFPDGVVQRMRVAAANGLATKYLARADTPQVGIIGSGWQAGSQLMAMTSVREVEKIRCFSPTEANRKAFATGISPLIGVDVEPVASMEAAIEDANVALCATSSIEPIFKAEWVRPGLHISSIKRPELHADAVRKVDRVVIHSRDGAPLLTMSGGVEPPVADRPDGGALLDVLDFETVPLLADLVAGKTPPRQSDEETTCFINNIGMGFQFAIIGKVVYDRALQTGIGRELPTEWFTQKEHP